MKWVSRCGILFLDLSKVEAIQNTPVNIIPAELWKAFALILIAVLVFVVKKYLAKLEENNAEAKISNKEFRDQLLKLTVNDAVQDERIENLEHNGKIVKYQRK